MKIFFLKSKAKDFLFQTQNQGQPRSCKASPAFILNWELSARISHQWSIDTGTCCLVPCIWWHQRSCKWPAGHIPFLRDHLESGQHVKREHKHPSGETSSFLPPVCVLLQDHHDDRGRQMTCDRLSLDCVYHHFQRAFLFEALLPLSYIACFQDSFWLLSLFSEFFSLDSEIRHMPSLFLHSFLFLV